MYNLEEMSTGAQAKLFEVYVWREGKGITGRGHTEVVLITKCESKAYAKTAELLRKGEKAWYKQIK